MDERDLERLFIDNAAFEAISGASNVFCPFDAVGMTDQEVKHGHFLQYMLDPARPHGLGSECLRAFMRSVAAIVAGAKLGFAPLDAHLMELDAAIVHRERDAIDLVIELPSEKLVVAIELKINAGEHSGQLGRYRKIVERDWPEHKRLLLFLTKRGALPSEDGAGWHPVPLKTVADAFEKVAKRRTGSPEAQMMLGAYVAMLRREHVTDERLERFAAELWREHREALDFLMKRRPDDKYALLAPLLERQSDAVDGLRAATGLAIVPEYSTKSQVYFGVSDWDGVPGMVSAEKGAPRMVAIRVSEYKNAIRAQFQLRPGDNRKTVFDKLAAVGADIGGNHAIGTSYRQLANSAICADDGSPLETFDSIVASLAAFINAHKDKYGEAMAALSKSAAD